MTRKLLALLFLFSCFSFCLSAQKPFTEGVIIYKVRLEATGNNFIAGTYVFTIKGDQVKKEIKLSNGYQDVVILRCGIHKATSLQNKNGKKYAIELNMPELLKDQQKFQGFTLNNEMTGDRNIAGCKVFTANVIYTDGTTAPLYYTKEWRTTQPITFERFPDAQFLPLNFSYKDEKGMTMWFEAEKIAPGPIDNTVFAVPRDYKMISYTEYKELNK